MHTSRNNELEQKLEKPGEKIKTFYRAKVRESLTCWGLERERERENKEAPSADSCCRLDG